jgi:hypothetical protein
MRLLLGPPPNASASAIAHQVHDTDPINEDPHCPIPILSSPGFAPPPRSVHGGGVGRGLCAGRHEHPEAEQGRFYRVGFVRLEPTLRFCKKIIKYICSECLAMD